MAERSRVFEELGIEPIINAHGHPTSTHTNAYTVAYTNAYAVAYTNAYTETYANFNPNARAHSHVHADS